MKMESNQKELGERGWVTGSKVVQVFVQSDGCLESDLTGSNTNYYDRHLGEKVKEGKIIVKLHARMKNDRTIFKKMETTFRSLQKLHISPKERERERERETDRQRQRETEGQRENKRFSSKPQNVFKKPQTELNNID